ncbi:hypothetical protein NC653_037760 [Populus alba x Populus x berolinensis]|uniref:Uncharacterized protein n=1 Tax=Populus alba x Populus x berolinensis TaxID=444605 RepID=A0AAD6PTA3_9ROSI|nr:hypothetical protein NC653_037760 [Populus alba x Populus x berolinensis]
MGSLCWLLDRLFSNKISRWYFNPEGHALWHVLMGFNAYFANTFLMFCRAQQLGWNPKVATLHGTFPVCENSKTKNPVTGAAKQMASFPLHFVWWQMYGFGRIYIFIFHMHPWMNVTYNKMQHESLRLKPTVRGSNMPKRHGGAQWAAAAYVTVANLIGSVQRL